MSPQALEKAFAEAEKQKSLPKAVIVVNLYGQSADYDTLGKICERYRVPIIEDAAESLGALYKGKASGTLGRYGVFSFNGNKIITTSGGGMLVSNDLKALEKARYWATQARDPVVHYEHSELGYNYRMSNVLAGIGRGQLKVLPERVRQRRQIFDRYVEELKDLPGINFMPEAPYGESTHWLTIMTLEESARLGANDIIDRLEEHDIEARPVWKPLHRQPVFKNCRFYPHSPGQDFSAEVFQKGLCLPSGTQMTEQDQLRIVKIVKDKLVSG